MNIRQNELQLALSLANITEEYAREMLRFFASSPISLMQQTIKSKRTNFNHHGRNWLHNHPHKDLDVELACLLMACREMSLASRSLKYKDRHGRDEILEADRLMSLIRQEQVFTADRKPRKKAKLEAIKVRLPMILALREKGWSWRNLSNYLKKHAGLKVSHVYLRETIKILAGEAVILTEEVTAEFIDHVQDSGE